MLLPSSIIDGYIIINLFGKIDIYNTDAKGRKTKRISLIETPLFESYWKQIMKEISY
jgi:hypothetical protein